VGILICYIVAAAIEIEKWSNNNLGNSYRVWPSWGWICAIVAGALWFFVGSFSACESSLWLSTKLSFCLLVVCEHKPQVAYVGLVS